MAKDPKLLEDVLADMRGGKDTPDAEAPAMEDGVHVAMEDFLAAMQSKDAAGMAAALKAGVTACTGGDY